MTRRIIIYVNGILTFPGEARNWNSRAVTWTHTNSEARAEKLEYWAGPIDRIFGQKKRAEKLALLLRHYGGWQVNVVGHSNGADVILDCLRDHKGLPCIERLHLVCGACEADFCRNGLNLAVIQGRVGSITVYVAGRDHALALAHSIPGRLLGYGTLGLSGALNATAPIREVRWDNYGHSTCFDGGHFDQTMNLLLSGS